MLVLGVVYNNSSSSSSPWCSKVVRTIESDGGLRSVEVKRSESSDVR